MLDIEKMSKEELLDAIRSAGITPECMDEQVFIAWSVEDITSEDKRPDLTPEQAMEVLRAVRDGHDSSLGVTWETLESMSDIMFPKETNTLITPESIQLANVALRYTSHCDIDSCGYSEYISDKWTNGLLTKEEAVTALHLGIHIVAISEIEDYHGSRKGMYDTRALKTVEQIDKYLGSLRLYEQSRISVDPVYEYKHIGEKALPLVELKAYIQTKQIKDK